MELRWQKYRKCNFFEVFLVFTLPSTGLKVSNLVKQTILHGLVWNTVQCRTIISLYIKLSQFFVIKKEDDFKSTTSAPLYKLMKQGEKEKFQVLTQ